MTIRAVLAASIAAGVAALVSASPAAARDYPFCIKGSDYDSSVGDCRFDTIQACNASASGLLAYCDANPYFRGPQPPVGRPRGSRRTY